LTLEDSRQSSERGVSLLACTLAAFFSFGKSVGDLGSFEGLEKKQKNLA